MGSAYAYYREKYGEPGNVPPQVAQLEKSQSALLKAEIARLAPRKDATNVYALGIAGWAEQDVFIKELDGGLDAIASVLPIKDRIVKLINNRATLGECRSPLRRTSPPPCTRRRRHEQGTGRAHAVHDLARRENRLRAASAGQDARADAAAGHIRLDGEGIKNRVVIVSACFAGIFLPPLANDNTIVLTAADATHTSFGCAPERDWTYFGDAFFRQSLHPGADFAQAFDHARVLIRGWEMMDRDPPSNPQGHFGPALVDKLAPLYAAAQGAGQ